MADNTPSQSSQSALTDRMTKAGIKETDIIERFIRGTGSGGQKINKTSSCVYLKHIPTGIEVKCQRGRSQYLNRFLARRELCERVESRILGIKTSLQQAAEKIRRQKRRRTRRQRSRLLREKRIRSELKTMRRPVLPNHLE